MSPSESNPLLLLKTAGLFAFSSLPRSCSRLRGVAKFHLRAHNGETELWGFLLSGERELTATLPALHSSPLISGYGHKAPPTAPRGTAPTAPHPTGACCSPRAATEQGSSSPVSMEPDLLLEVAQTCPSIHRYSFYLGKPQTTVVIPWVVLG